MGDVAGVAMLAALVAAFVGLLVAWGKAYAEARNPELGVWRRKTAIVGTVAATLQAALFIAIWTPLGRNSAWVKWFTWGEVLFFLVAVPCAITRKGWFRGWLLFSSGALAAFYFMTRLVDRMP